jgi:hypothetical protein
MTLKERVDLHDRQIAAHDRQIAAIRDLVKEGMRLMIETRKDMRIVIAMHKRNEQRLETLINTMKRGTNAHSKKRVDIQ